MELPGKLDEILRKLDQLASLHEEVKSLKADFLTQSAEQKEEVRRLAGKFEYLLNFQNEMHSKLVKIEKVGTTVDSNIKKVKESVCEILATVKQDITDENLTDKQLEMETDVDKDTRKPDETKKIDIVSCTRENSIEKEDNGGHTTKGKTNDVIYKCVNLNCNEVFHTIPPFKKDGVSFSCPNEECGVLNIVGTLKPDHKWVGTICRKNFCWHCQQVSVKMMHETYINCSFCGKYARMMDTTSAAIEWQENIDGTMNKLNGIRKEHYFKCWNSNCDTRLMKPVIFREDEVSTVCANPACLQINIVGNLKPENRWMAMKCYSSWHFQQFPVTQKHDGLAKCQVCGMLGKTYGASAREAVYAIGF